MSEISFNEDEYKRSYTPEGNSGMIGLVIKHSGGLIKNTKQANIFLLFVVVVIIIITFVLMPNDDLNLEDLPYEGSPNNIYIK